MGTQQSTKAMAKARAVMTMTTWGRGVLAMVGMVGERVGEQEGGILHGPSIILILDHT